MPIDTRITFKGALGESLAARLDSPDNPKAYALFAHCFSCGKDLTAVSRISRALNKEGLALFRFDFTGLGSSGGDFANTNFTSNVQDLVAAADFMRENYEAPKIMIGHSLGGTAVLAAAHKIPEVRAIATIGSPYDASHVMHLFKDQLCDIRDKGEAEINVAGRSFKIKKQFLEDIEGQSTADHLKEFKGAVLVMHSPADDIVEIENARMIFAAAHHPKSFISLDDADHLILDDPKDAEYVARVLAAWSSRYLEQ